MPRTARRRGSLGESRHREGLQRLLDAAGLVLPHSEVTVGELTDGGKAMLLSGLGDRRAAQALDQLALRPRPLPEVSVPDQQKIVFGAGQDLVHLRVAGRVRAHGLMARDDGEGGLLGELGLEPALLRGAPGVAGRDQDFGRPLAVHVVDGHRVVGLGLSEGFDQLVEEGVVAVVGRASAVAVVSSALVVAQRREDGSGVVLARFDVEGELLRALLAVRICEDVVAGGDHEGGSRRQRLEVFVDLRDRGRRVVLGRVAPRRACVPDDCEEQARELASVRAHTSRIRAAVRFVGAAVRFVGAAVRFVRAAVGLRLRALAADRVAGRVGGTNAAPGIAAGAVGGDADRHSDAVLADGLETGLVGAAWVRTAKPPAVVAPGVLHTRSLGAALGGLGTGGAGGHGAGLCRSVAARTTVRAGATRAAIVRRLPAAREQHGEQERGLLHRCASTQQEARHGSAGPGPLQFTPTRPALCPRPRGVRQAPVGSAVWLLPASLGSS